MTVLPEPKMEKMFDYDIMLSIDLTTKCNLDCEYCYSKKNYDTMNLWGEETSKEKVEKIKTFLIHLQDIGYKKIQIMLLGGESSQSLYFEDFVSFCVQKKFKVILYTNLFNFKEKSSLRNIVLKHSNIMVNISLHLVAFEKIYKNIKSLIKLIESDQGSQTNHPQRNIKIDLLYQKENYSKLISDDFIKFIENNIHKEYVDFNLEIIDDFRDTFYIDQLKTYSSSDLNPLKKITDLLKPSVKLNNEIKPVFDFIKLKYNTKAICYLNEFHIDFNLDITRACVDEKIGNLDDINYNAFSNITPIICPKKTTCPCYYLCQVKKEII